MLLPQSIAVNLSYMFPSAAAPNAIVFGPGYIKLQDMVIFKTFFVACHVLCYLL